MSSFNSWTLKTWVSALEFFSYVVYRLRYKYFRFVCRHLGFLSAACVTQYRKFVHWIPWPRKHWCRRWNFSAMLYTSWDISISGLCAAILDFWLPFASNSIRNIFIEFLNLENMDVAVGIFQLCYIHVEIWVFPLWGNIIVFCLLRNVGYCSLQNFV